MAHLFISYNREDQYRARAIADALEAEGFAVWWDTNLRAGESYDEVTEKNLREAGAVVVLWSTRSVNSKWVRAEATVGERFSKLVPAMIEECERPLRFELVQTADLISWHGDREDKNWREFIHDVKSALGHEAGAPEPTAAAAPPGAAAAGPAADVTIENTFWNSIKDGGEKAEFEAYLNRYPHGHFTDLARARLAGLERAEMERKAAAAAPPRAAAGSAGTIGQGTPAHRPPAQGTAPPVRQATPEQARRQPQAAPAAPLAPPPRTQQTASAPPKASSGLPMMAIAAGAVVIGLGALAALQFGGAKEAAPAVVVASTASTQTQTAQSEPAPSQIAPSQAVPSQAVPLEAAPAGASAAAPEAADPANTNLASTTEGVASNANAPANQPLDAGNPAPSAAANGVFSDCELCPTMKLLPAGAFMMGSPESEPGRFAYEGPLREVSIPRFAIGVHEVTHDQWTACVADGGCGGYAPGDAGFGAGARPVLSVSWDDAQAYARWLSAKTGKTYRLPTEAEWEYAARGGVASAYWWGTRFDQSKAALGETVETGSLPANGFGLYEMAGNASEWVQDCYVNNFSDAPTDGSSVNAGDCSRRVIRGGSWRSKPSELRSANRSRVTRSTRDRGFGFRIAMDVE
ncbi:MAG: SUMF1/EgtB/PvdO family nonheme iron enzyme [Pseudomonadota bacterium]